MSHGVSKFEARQIARDENRPGCFAALMGFAMVTVLAVWFFGGVLPATSARSICQLGGYENVKMDEFPTLWDGEVPPMYCWVDGDTSRYEVVRDSLRAEVGDGD